MRRGSLVDEPSSLVEKLKEIAHRSNAELDLQQELCRCSQRHLLEANLVHDEADLLIRGSEESDVPGICADAAVDVGG